jgi:hypothetical protein
MSIQPTTYPRSGLLIDRRARAHRDEAVVIAFLGAALLVRCFIPSGLVDLFEHYSTLGGSILEKLHPGAYALIALTGLVLFTQEYTPSVQNQTFARGSYALLLAVLAAVVIGLLTGRTGGISYLLDSLIMGSIVGLTMLRLSSAGRARILTFLLLLLVFNDLLLFGEYATHNRLMPYIYHEPFFRPTAFLGHPLMNGLINATAIAFVWVMPWSNARKVSFTIFFMTACFASGARMASIFSVLAALMCMWVELGRSARKGKIDEGALITISIVALGVVLIAITIVVLSGLADRLIANGFFNDGSSQSRFLIYGIFKYMNFQQLMFGISREWATYMITQILNLPRSESPIVDFVVQFGIVGTVILVSGLVVFFLSYARASANAFVIIGTMIFAATASTNNTFSGKGADMAFFAAFVLGATGTIAAKRPTKSLPFRRQVNEEVASRPS